jgi:hypothetical protein
MIEEYIDILKINKAATCTKHLEQEWTQVPHLLACYRSKLSHV